MSGPSASPAHRAHSNRVNNNSSSSSSKSSNRDNTSLATPVSKRAAHAQSVPYTRRTTRSLATKPGASPLQELKDTHTQRKPRTAKSISVEPDASQENANRANGVLVKAAESPPHEASPTPSERPTTRFAQQQLLLNRNLTSSNKRSLGDPTPDDRAAKFRRTGAKDLFAPVREAERKLTSPSDQLMREFNELQEHQKPSTPVQKADDSTLRGRKILIPRAKFSVLADFFTPLKRFIRGNEVVTPGGNHALDNVVLQIESGEPESSPAPSMSSASGTPSLPITTHTPSSDNAPDSDGHIPTSPSLPPTPSTNGVDPLQRPEKTLDSSPLQRSSLSNQPEQVIANGHLEPQTESMLEETMLSVTSTDTSILSDQTTPTPALHTEHHTQNYAPRAPSTPPQARASLFGNAASLVARTLGSFTPTFKRTPQQLPASQPAKVLTSIDTTMEDVEQSPASSISRHVNGQPSHGFPRRQPSTPYPKRKLTRIANEPEIDPWESTKNDLHHRTSVRTTRKQMADHLFQQFMKLKPSKKDKELLQEILKELHQRAIGDTIDEMNNAGLSFRMRDRDIGTEAEYLNTERRLVRHLKPIEEEEIPRIVKQYIDAIISEKQDEFYWDERTGTVVQKELVLATPIATKPNSILRRTATPGKRLVKISELSAIPNPKDGFGMDERYFDTDDSLVEQSDYSDPMPKTSKRKRVNVNTLKQIPNPKGGFGMNDKYFGDNSMVTVSDNSTMTPPVKKARLGQSTAKSVRFFSPKSGKIRRTTQTPSTVADMSAYTASTPTPGYSWPTPGTPGYRHTWDRPQEEPSSSENVFTGSPTGRELAPYNPGDGVNEDASDLAEWSPTEKKKFLKTGHVSGSGSFCVPEGDAEDSSMLDATISEYDEHATPGTPEQPMYANQTQLPSTLSAPKPQANGVSTKVSVTPTTDAKATTTPKSAAQIDSSAIILREEEIDTEDTESVDALDGISTDGSDFDIEDYYDGAGPLSPTDSDDAITPEEWWDIVTGGLDHLKKPNAAEEEAIEKARRNAEKFKPAKGSALRNVSKGDEDDDSDIGIDEDDAYDRAVIKRLMGLFDTDGEEIEDKQLTPKKYVKVMDAVKKHLPELELESD